MFERKRTGRAGTTLILAGASWLLASGAGGPPPAEAAASDYAVVWHSPGKSADDSMPLGNGDVGANVWTEPNGDLVFYVSKTDAWGDNGRLLKVGKVRISFDPPLFREGDGFRQELDPETATLSVRTPDAERTQPNVRLRVDANHPVVEVRVETDRPTTATLSIELWRTNRCTLSSIEVSDAMYDPTKPKAMRAPTIVEPDTVASLPEEDRIGWYHRNVKSVGPKEFAEVQGMADYSREDPLLHRIFGAVVTADHARKIDDRHLQSGLSNRHRFSVYVLTKRPATSREWLSAMNRTIEETERIDPARRRSEHETWWRNFWDRSRIWITPRDPVFRPISKDALPVRIGVDRNGKRRFAGRIRSLSISGRVPSEAEIAKRHAAGPPRRAKRTEPDEKALEGDLCVETWINPAPGGGGPIADNRPPGKTDGFLLEVLPENGLRFSVGRTVVAKEGCLTPGTWQHVVATVDARSGAVGLFLDGTNVASGTVPLEESDAFIVSRAYALQRFVTACAGRGRYPIKFNGSIFTVPAAGTPGDADYRRWGPGYWWQNTRLTYWPLCASGDYDLMEALFRTYVDDFLPLNRYRTERYFGFANAAYYPECVSFWGDVFNETYGWEPPMKERKDPLQLSRWHKREWVCGPELVWMMLNVYAHTRDESLLKNRIVPTATAVMRFFDAYYETGASGKLKMQPAQALETWWDCADPMPEVAGLRAVCDALAALPESSVPPADRVYWARFRKKIPELPTCRAEGARVWAPAKRFATKRNSETPELYCVFPFRRCSFEKENRDLGIRTLEHRCNRGASGWYQDGLFMAHLGLAEEARKNLVERARNHHKASRFPAFWGPNFDWVPDQDHGGVLLGTLQSMLMQTDVATGKIYLLPAWPKDWNCDFKLHAPERTTVEGRVENGKIVALTVSPASRRKDVTIAETRDARGAKAGNR